jgi:hypothetical protein
MFTAVCLETVVQESLAVTDRHISNEANPAALPRSCIGQRWALNFLLTSQPAHLSNRRLSVSWTSCVGHSSCCGVMIDNSFRGIRCLCERGRLGAQFRPCLCVGTPIPSCACGRCCSLLMPRGHRFPLQGLQDLQILQDPVVCVHCWPLVALSHCSTVPLIPLGLLLCHALPLQPFRLLPRLLLLSLLTGAFNRASRGRAAWDMQDQTSLCVASSLLLRAVDHFRVQTLRASHK